MKKLSVILFCLLCTVILSAQSIEEIKKEKERSEKTVAYLNNLLNETSSSKSVSLNRLKIIKEKVSESKKLLNALNQEVKYIERQIIKNEKDKNELLVKKEELLDLYAKMVYSLWKKRDNTSKLMFIFASSDFNQAYKRYKYFEQIQSYSKRQLVLMSQIDDSLYMKNKELKEFIEQKNATLAEINAQNRDLVKEQSNESKLVQEMQKKEKEIASKIKEEQRAWQRLDKELEKLIEAQNKKSSNSSKVYALTPEEKILSENFASNKGKLPWPVEKGMISEKMGTTTHPVHTKVHMANKGISITTSKNSEIRSVFKGVVSEIVISGNKYYNNVVIVRHGNYLTLYTNLVELYVRKGDTVDTKQLIGRVGFDEEKGSVLNFQIWNNQTRLNPELWLAK